MNKKPTFWTQDKKEVILQHWNEGKLSTVQIANLIGCGCTKNMVISQARRLRLKGLIASRNEMRDYKIRSRKMPKKPRPEAPQLQRTNEGFAKRPKKLQPLSEDDFLKRRDIIVKTARMFKLMY